VNGILEDQNGILYGVAAAGGDGYGGIYAVAFADPGLAPAIQLSPADANVLVGQPVEFTWRVNNAYSATMQQCVARVNNQTISAVPLSGTYTYVPPASGTYRVAITCGGAETAYSDVDVTAAKTPTQTGMFIGFGPGSFIQTSPYVSKLGNTTYGQPTGSVGLALNGRVFASVALPLPATQGDAYINGGIPSGLPNGTYTLAAEYSGDAGDLPSSSTPIPLTVNGSTVGVFAYSGAGVDSSTGEAYASLGYAVLNTSTSAPDPTGTVAFSLRGNTFATVPLGGGAEGPVGFCSITGSIPPGTYDIAATYSGDANNPPVSTTQTVVVP
jgi:hypothetical protein